MKPIPAYTGLKYIGEIPKILEGFGLIEKGTVVPKEGFEEICQGLYSRIGKDFEVVRERSGKIAPDAEEPDPASSEG